MIGIDYDSRILERRILLIAFEDRLEILVVIVRMRAAELIDITSQDAVCKRVTLRLNFPSSVYELLGTLGCDSS